MLDRRVIACNHLTGTSAIPTGALCYVSLLNPGGGNDRICILARSRSGRWIRKWEAANRLGNFRLKTLPPEHPLYREERIRDAGKEDLTSLPSTPAVAPARPGAAPPGSQSPGSPLPRGCRTGR